MSNSFNLGWDSVKRAASAHSALWQGTGQSGRREESMERRLFSFYGLNYDDHDDYFEWHNVFVATIDDLRALGLVESFRLRGRGHGGFGYQMVGGRDQSFSWEELRDARERLAHDRAQRNLG